MDIKESLIKREFKQVNLYNEFYINSKGELYRIFTNYKGIKILKSISISKTKEGNLKANFTVNNKNTSLLISVIVYETFKNKLSINDSLCFIDGNKLNCKLDNLITQHELLKFYRDNI